ncbi:MAG: Gfo/Idh/MocA family oxidoreductase [Pirellulales bacterium]|nr:Gfo/Idh/MocA family oxidoreductase [Pirellulales bacterium]
MVRIGIVGIGFMGMIHYLAWQRVRGAKVVAISTRDRVKLAGDWRGIKGNFGPAGTQVELAHMRRYAELDDLLADNKVDLVDICLPPALHARVARAAFAAGKHVLCEKPIALALPEAESMRRAAERAKRMLLVAHVLPFFPEFATALKLVQGGRYGALLGGHFKRIISDPLWIKDFYDPRTVGGPVIDLHIHDAHFIRLLAGMPQSIASTGRMRGEVVELINSQFLYGAGGPTITATGGVIRQQGRPFTHGFEIYLERATLVYDFAAFITEPARTPLTLLSADGKVTQLRLGSDDPIEVFAAELGEAARAIKTAKPSALLSGDLACDALRLCQRETESVRKGKPVRV